MSRRLSADEERALDRLLHTTDIERRMRTEALRAAAAARLASTIVAALDPAGPRAAQLEADLLRRRADAVARADRASGAARWARYETRRARRVLTGGG
jgi:hypothetical protein